ncbi:hemagglutinin repeat-containing protein [Pseudomonas sp.]|uniref:hemagglutinin repeat-containing protein n=1 Tax=Pseudomonas sp. TaxID=306 RepID=UPI003A9745C3
MIKADAASLDNRGGELSAKQGLTLNADSVNTGDKGLISSGATLALDAGQVAAANQGEISAKGDISLRAGQLQQQGGRLIGESNVSLDLKGGKLDNQSGVIAAQGQLTLVDVGQLDNRAGTLSAQQQFKLSAQQIDNRNQGLIGSSGSLMLDAQRLDSSNQGEVSASGDINLHAAELVQHDGRLLGQSGVTLDVDGLLDNQGGVIHGKQGLNLKADNIDNSTQGLISSNGLLVLTAQKLDSSNQGEVSAQGDIQLRIAQLIQQQGRLIGEGSVSLDLNGGALNNRGGVIYGRQGLSLLAGAVDNSDKGLINTAGALSLTADRLDSSQKGELSAEKDIDLNLGELVQNNGQLIGGGNISFDLNGGLLDNQDGLINARDGLELKQVGELRNLAGELSSSGDISVSAATLNNTQNGRVIAAGQLAIDASTVNNSGAGLLSGWQGVRIDGAQLDNSKKGTVSSRDGGLDLTLSGALDNSAEGALVSQEAQRILAGSLDNSDKGIVSSDSGLVIDVTGMLNNSNQGLISAPILSVEAAQTLNQGGSINSAGDLLLSGGSFNNSGGSISASQALTAKLTGELRNNSSGKIVSGTNMLLELDSLNNRAGQLASQGLLEVFANSLDNSNSGTLAVQDEVTLNVNGALNNRNDGLIYSRQGGLNIEAASINNDAGTLQAKSLLDLQGTAAVSNKAGTVLTEAGDLEIGAERVDNSAGGVLASTLGSIKLVLNSLFDNRGGTTQAKQDVDLSTTASNGQVLNSKGHFSAVAGHNRIKTGTFNNQGGGLFAGDLLDVDAISFANQGLSTGLGGKVSASTIDFDLSDALNNRYGLIEAGDVLRLNSASIDNQQGALRALGLTGESRLATSALLDNSDGRIEVANNDLTFAVGSLLNTDGTILHVGSGKFGLASDTLTQAGGTLVTNGALTVNAGTWNHDGTVQARDLTLNVGTLNQSATGQLLAKQRLIASGGNWSNAGLIASDGSLDVTLSGGYSGEGRLTSLGDMSLKGANLDLSSMASIAAGGLGKLTFSGLVNNRGVLSAGDDFTLRAANLNNYGTLGGAKGLKLYAGSLRNEGGLIFSGADMALRTATLTNLRGNLYSLGDLDIAADDNDGWATRVENTSGSLESAGDMRILAGTLLNQREAFSAELRLVSGNLDIYSDDVCDGKGCEFYFNSVENYEDVIAEGQDSPIGFITSGADLNFQGENFHNLYSTVSAAGDININVVTFRNLGMGGGEQRHYNAGYYTRSEAVYWQFIDAKNQFNHYNDPTSADYQPGKLSVADVLAVTSQDDREFFNITSYTVPTSGAVVASAIVQAGGAVNITAAERFDNSVVREYADGVGQIGSQNTAVDTRANTGNWAITSQLPPDLAQKQVNPLNLPGFSLPTGDNGLFRLSDQSAHTGQQGYDGTASQSANGKSLGDQVISASFGGSALAQQVQKVGGLPSTEHTAGSHKYLIEANPALTNLKDFLGSDYLLGELGYDPDRLQRRLGDGLYEQHLIRQAIVERTGQRYLAGLYDDEAMFRYLMDNAIASKDALNLRLGVALSAEQIAALTHDIVWMEEHEVLGEKVLVPVLYLAQAEGRLAGNGALIQGGDLNLISGGDLNNVGTLRASGNLNATASNINNAGLIEANERLQLLATDSIINARGGIITGRDVNLTALNGDVINERTITRVTAAGGGDRLRNDIANNASRIEAGNNLVINAARDISNRGSAIEAKGNASLSAGRDLVVSSQAEVDTYEYQRKREHGYDNSTIQHASNVDFGGDLSLSAQRDIAVIGSQVTAAGDVSVNAGRDLSIVSAANEEHQYSYRKQGETKTTKQADEVQQQGSLIQAGNNLSLGAGNDIALVASSVDAGNEAYLVAANDIDIDAGFDSQSHYYYKKKKKSGTFSSSTKTRLDSTSDTFAQGSLVSGDKTTVLAGNTLNIRGSDVVSTQTTTLQGGQAVNIEGVTETSTSEHYQKKTKSGLMGSGGIGVTIGSSSLQSRGQTVIETTRGSTVGSVEGNVEILTGGKLKIKGSDIVAGQNVSLYGQDVEISAAENLSRNQQEHKSKKSGLTLALSGVVGSAINTAYETSRQVDDEESGRLAALQGVKAALTGYQAMQAVEQAGGITGENAGQFVGISLSLGSQKSKSKQVQEQRVSQGSQVTAGDNITIVATGSSAANDGDVKVIGSQLQAGKDLLVQANRDIELLAAANTQKIEGKNSSGGGAVGVSLGVSDSGAGLSIFANANSGLGKEKGNATTWTETTLDAGNQVSLVSGRDTTLAGAQVSADQIKALVAGNLSLESLQDSDHYSAKQSNVSAGGSFTFGTMTGSGYLGVSKDKLNSKFDSVQEQTGLFAGNGGYQIDVGEHTQLDGSVIASTATADKNVLSTGTLGWGDISNRAEFETKTQSVNLSSGGVVGEQFIGNLATTTLLGAGNEGEDSSTTHSAISEGSLVVRDAQNQEQDTATLSRDVENANNALSPIFDKEKEQRRLREAQLIGDIGRQTIDIVRTQGEIEASRKGKEELAQSGIYEPGPGATQDERKIYQERLTNSAAYKKEMEPYGTGGSYQLVAQAATAALQGLAGNNLGSALAGASAPYLAQKIKQITGDNKEARLMAHAVLGAIVAQSNNNSAAAGAAGAVSGELAAEYIAAQLYPNKKVADLSEQEKQSVSAMATLAAGLLGGAVGGDSASAIAGAQSGKNAVENNYLSPAQEEQKDKELKGCNDLTCRVANETKWNLISAQQNAGLLVGVGGGIGLSAYETAEGLYQLMGHLPETLDAIKQFANSPEFRQQFGDSYFSDLEQRAALLTQAYNDAGWGGSVTAGVEGGKFAVELVGVLTAVRGTAQVAAKLPSAAKNVVNALAEAPVTGSWRAQAGAVGDLSKLDAPGGAKGNLTPKDFPDVAGKISQKQLRHIAGRPELEARGGGGFLNSVDDAQKVLDAYRVGQVKILGKNAQGFPVVKFEGVTGTNVNAGVGITGQPTNVFIIKGTKSPSIVPANPNWTQK